jgi:hypothetical protein
MIVAKELSATALQEYVTPIHDINLDLLVIENLDDLAFHFRDGVVKIEVKSMLGVTYVNKYLDAFARDLWFASFDCELSNTWKLSPRSSLRTCLLLYCIASASTVSARSYSNGPLELMILVSSIHTDICTEVIQNSPSPSLNSAIQSSSFSYEVRDQSSGSVLAPMSITKLASLSLASAVLVNAAIKSLNSSVCCSRLVTRCTDVRGSTCPFALRIQ